MYNTLNYLVSVKISYKLALKCLGVCFTQDLNLSRLCRSLINLLKFFYLLSATPWCFPLALLFL